MPKDSREHFKPKKVKIEGPEDEAPQLGQTEAGGAVEADPPPAATPAEGGDGAAPAEEDWRALYEAEHDQHLRAVAELQNLRKRAARERAELLQYANERLLRQLLEVLDNFELAMAAVREAREPGAVAQGVQMILEQLRGLVADFGVTPLETVGAQFDPHWHEAVERIETPDAPEGRIIAEVKKGYRLHDRLLRPARVKVAVAPRGE